MAQQQKDLGSLKHLETDSRLIQTQLFFFLKELIHIWV